MKFTEITSVAAYSDIWDTTGKEKQLDQEIAEKKRRMFLFEDKNVIYGGCSIRRLDASVRLSYFVVQKEYRKQGIGTKVLKLLEEKLVEEGIYLITLEADTTASAGFYENHGYVSRGMDERGRILFEKELKKHLAVYVHIPFCVLKCIYCDFLSMPAQDSVKVDYVKALSREIRDFGAAKGKDYVVDTVFFGGGTPSILKLDLFMELMEALRSSLFIEKDCEFTIECNPGTVDREKLQAYREAGVNRLSFGLQSVVDSELKLLGRIHTYDEFLNSYELARTAGFDNINIDIMTALPGQTVKSFSDTLNQVAGLNPEHISAYSLIIEEGTPLEARISNGEEFYLPDEDQEREIYHLTETILEEYGYHRYEISNYSRDNKECAHNKAYWQMKEYIGFGAGAASCIDHTRFTNTRDISAYITNPLHNLCEEEQSDQESEMAEFMILGLRMTRGVSRRQFYHRFQREMDSVYMHIIDKYTERGLLENQGDILRLTAEGLDLCNIIFTDII